MNYNFITIPEDEHVRLQIEEYKRIVFKYRDFIVALREERDALKKENERMTKFINRFFDTEDLGWTYGKAMRDDAREALGMERVETN